MDSPASRLIVYGALFAVLISMAFAFFSLTGGSVRNISGHFGLGLAEVVYEPAPPDGARRHAAAAPEAPRKRYLPMPEVGAREPSVPETPAEEQYFEAVRKANEQAERQAKRLKTRDEWRRFLDTPLGRDFRAVAELSRRGRTREAREYVRKVLQAMSESAPKFEIYALKLAAHIYKVEKDREGLAWALKRYMELTRDRISSSREENDSDRDSAGSLAEIDAMIGKVDAAAGGGTR